MHKNKNEANGNYVIYVLRLFGKIFKIGKADNERRTVSTNLPIRVHSQIRGLGDLFGKINVSFSFLEFLVSKTTKEAKKREDEYLNNYFEQTGEIPEGNAKSFKKKKK
jgi:hypothetical protein